MSAGEGNTQLTVNLIPLAVTALEQAAMLEGNSQTDTVNRALQAYAFIVMQQRTGKRFLLYDEVLDASTEVTFK